MLHLFADLVDVLSQSECNSGLVRFGTPLGAVSQLHQSLHHVGHSTQALLNDELRGTQVVLGHRDKGQFVSSH